MRIFIACIACLTLAACQGVLLLGLNAVDDARGAGPERSFVFLPSRGLGLDVHPAAAAGPAPVVVFFYGGSWRNGERGWYRFVGRRLSEAGLVVVIPDYRGYPDTHFPGFMEDAAAAVAWVAARASEHGGDPTRIFLMGHSAGAHIAALLATDPRHLEAAGLSRAPIAGVIGLSGPYDFLPITSRRLLDVFPDPAAWPDSQPVNFVDAQTPPMLLIHGGDDRTVGAYNSERLARRLADLGVPVQLHIFPGHGHAATLVALSSLRDAPPVLETLLRFVAATPPRGRGPVRPAALGDAPEKG
jgi:acetyl esterase/lipase